MNPWLLFLIESLATYRLALMLSSEEGPLAIFARMRRKVPPKTNPGRGIRCFNCWSIYTSGLSVLVASQLPILIPFLLVFAVSGAAMLFNRSTDS